MIELFVQSISILMPVMESHSGIQLRIFAAFVVSAINESWSLDLLGRFEKINEGIDSNCVSILKTSSKLSAF